MRILFFAVSDMLQEGIVSGIESLPEHHVIVTFYDKLPIPLDRPMLNAAYAVRPDIILWTGRHDGPTVPCIDTFLRLKRFAPTVFILHDGSEALWQDRLKEYREKDVFSLTVNIDGNTEWPKGPGDLTLLTPIDPRFYQRAA